MKHLGLTLSVLFFTTFSLSAANGLDSGPSDLLKEAVKNRMRVWTPKAAAKARRPLNLYSLPQLCVLVDTQLDAIKEKVERICMEDALTSCGLFEPGTKFDGFQVQVHYEMSENQFKKQYQKPLKDMLKDCLASVCSQLLIHKLVGKQERNHPRASEKKRYKEVWIKFTETPLAAQG